MRLLAAHRGDRPDVERDDLYILCTGGTTGDAGRAVAKADLYVAALSGSSSHSASTTRSARSSTKRSLGERALPHDGDGAVHAWGRSVVGLDGAHTREHLHVAELGALARRRRRWRTIQAERVTMIPSGR